MKSLRVLDLSCTSISSLPASMSYLTNLQVILLDDCGNLEDISALGSQNKLQVLSLRSTEVKEMSEVVGKFTGLKYLDLRDIENLRIPPKVISNLRQLEELHVGDSFTEWEVGGEETEENAPFHEIQSLKKLKVLSIKVDKYWEDMLDRVLIERLERFHIVVGPSLEELETLELEKCKEMEFIVIGQNSSSVPCTILPRLKDLYLEDMEKLRGICSSPLPNGSLEELKTLRLEKCKEMEFIVIGQNSSTSLEELYIWRQDSMREVFSTCSASRALLPRLRRMNLSDLPELMSIWKGDSVPPLGSFSNLIELKLIECNELKYALSPNLAQRLESLEDLHVKDCNMMKGLISPSFHGFCNLRILTIENCSGFIHLFLLRVAQSLVELERLYIEGCEHMEVIVRGEEGEAGSERIFPRLQEVCLRWLPNLTSFCSVVGAGQAFAPVLLLPSLSKVYVFDCPRLTRLPLGSHSSPNLEKIWLKGLVWDDEEEEDDEIDKEDDEMARPVSFPFLKHKK
ncbi:hypothetical protein QJS04_geneDACA021265 [Acorus gramineus]|uniref:Disease resistance protein At4g27190-like leucine-rich repeats domain-containing protein n=1 Tax=Acorus gramineus TaxID=55184 RepID=A0AAV9BVU6_ACOGR|nr:hypothetical protein QJS04_geneDACA021265 [Acorus gramineus]